jgi:hypothetical protein
MINMSNDGHISDVSLLVHQGTNLIDSKINLFKKEISLFFSLDSTKLTMIEIAF